MIMLLNNCMMVGFRTNPGNELVFNLFIRVII